MRKCVDEFQWTYLTSKRQKTGHGFTCFKNWGKSQSINKLNEIVNIANCCDLHDQSVCLEMLFLCIGDLIWNGIHTYILSLHKISANLLSWWASEKEVTSIANTWRASTSMLFCHWIIVIDRDYWFTHTIIITMPSSSSLTILLYHRLCLLDHTRIIIHCIQNPLYCSHNLCMNQKHKFDVVIRTTLQIRCKIECFFSLLTGIWSKSGFWQRISISLSFVK